MVNSLKAKLISSTSGPMPSLFAQLGRTKILDSYLVEISKNAIQPSVRAKAYRSQLERRMVWVDGRKWVWTDKSYCLGSFAAKVSERTLTVSTSILDLIKMSATDRSSIVRRISAEFLIRELDSLGGEALEIARQFAWDKSSAVSEKSEFSLKRLSKVYSVCDS